jgi:hypothetical protein
MKVRMLVGLAGVDYVLRRGGVYSLPDPRAVSLIKRGLAEPVREISKENSVFYQVEKAVVEEVKPKADVQADNSTSDRADRPNGSKSTSKGNGNRRRKSDK